MSTAVLLDVQAALVQQMLAPASPPPPEQQCKSADTPLVAVMGWLGCVAAWLLFLAPMPTMRKIIRSRHIHEFSPLPYLISMLQCFLWTVYALPAVTPCKTQPLVTNGAGFVLELVYVLIFIRYAHAQRWAMLLKFAIVIAIAAFVCVAALVLAPHFDFKSFPDPDASRSTTVLGWTCSVFNVAMYAAPLSVVYTVLQRRSVRNMPLPLTLGCGLCSGFWTAYALMVLDMFILVSSFGARTRPRRSPQPP